MLYQCAQTLNAIFFLLLRLSEETFAVTLTSSADSVCPGDTVVFTCVTDTAPLIWSSNGTTETYFTPSQVNQTAQTLDIFSLQLVATTGGFTSTATIHKVSLYQNGANITCSDNANDDSGSKKESIVIEPPPSSPFNLTVISRVAISWVAPLDTPFCVNNYAVTVRNSCNSSQVMVYHTTDNRSSLNITDLTSDGEYSVTVAGRDGAGRLGQESEEICFKCIDSLCTRIGYEITNWNYSQVHLKEIVGVLIEWKIHVACCSRDHIVYIIKHNISSKQFPIIVNRTNVTLYGVQPGETYTVEIIPYTLHFYGNPLRITLSIPNMYFITPSSFQRPDMITITSAVLAVTTISKMIVTTLTVSSSTNQSASLCSCPANDSTSQQSIHIWVLIIPWILLALIIISGSVLICYFKFARKAKSKFRNEHFTNWQTSKNSATQLKIPTTTNVQVASCDNIVQSEESTGDKVEINVESRIYDEIKDRTNDVQEPFNIKQNVSYAAVSHTTF